MRRSVFARLLFAALALLAAPAALAQPAAPPERPPAFPAEPRRPDFTPIPAQFAPPDLPVPDAAKKLGVVYSTIAGKERQVTFSSDALNEHIDGFSNQVHGYCVKGDPDAPAALKAGRWRLRVTSLHTGIAARDEHLAQPMWLDAAQFPFIDFNLTKVTDLKETDAGVKDAKAWTCTLEGDLTLHGVTKSVKLADAKITLLPRSDETAKVAPGDLMRLTVSYSVLLSDYGVTNEVITLRKKVADQISIVTDLVLNDVPPDQEAPKIIGADPMPARLIKPDARPPAEPPAIR